MSRFCNIMFGLAFIMFMSAATSSNDGFGIFGLMFWIVGILVALMRK